MHFIFLKLTRTWGISSYAWFLLNTVVVYGSSRINTHLMFPLFPENRKSIPKRFIGKNFLKMLPSRFFILSQ